VATSQIIKAVNHRRSSFSLSVVFVNEMLVSVWPLNMDEFTACHWNGGA